LPALSARASETLGRPARIQRWGAAFDAPVKYGQPMKTIRSASSATRCFRVALLTRSASRQVVPASPLTLSGIRRGLTPQSRGRLARTRKPPLTSNVRLHKPLMIEVVPYNPEWPAQFAAEKAALQAALSPWLVGEIEHIGSTAVVGLFAKPVIDIMAPVASLEDSVAAIPAALAIGYLHHPYREQVMHWFCKPSPEIRTHHLHLVPLGSQLWVERLAFRDALRENLSLSSDYSALKMRLAELYRTDREAYTNAKAPFVQGVVSHFLARRDNAT
jgi:GrpB-like predicted nucleotidyltransferase (UPF0157 family)